MGPGPGHYTPTWLSGGLLALWGLSAACAVSSCPAVTAPVIVILDAVAGALAARILVALKMLETQALA